MFLFFEASAKGYFRNSYKTVQLDCIVTRSFAGADALRRSLVRFKLVPEVIMVEHGRKLHVVHAANALLFRNGGGNYLIY